MKAQLQDIFGLRKFDRRARGPAAPLGDESNPNDANNHNNNTMDHSGEEDEEETEFDLTDLMVRETPKPKKEHLSDETKERLSKRLAASMTEFNPPPPPMSEFNLFGDSDSNNRTAHDSLGGVGSSHVPRKTKQSHLPKQHQQQQHTTSAKPALRPPTKDTPTYNNSSSNIHEASLSTKLAEWTRFDGPPPGESMNLLDMATDHEFDAHMDRLQASSNKMAAAAPAPAPFPLSPTAPTERRTRTRQPPARTRSRSLTDLHRDSKKGNNGSVARSKRSNSGSRRAPRKPPRKPPPESTTTTADKKEPIFHPFPTSTSASTTTHTKQSSSRKGSTAASATSRSTKRSHRSRGDSIPSATAKSRDSQQMPSKTHSEGARRKASGSSYKSGNSHKKSEQGHASADFQQSGTAHTTKSDGDLFVEPRDENVTSEWSKADRSQKEKWKRQHLSSSSTTSPPAPSSRKSLPSLPTATAWDDNDDEAELILDLSEPIPHGGSSKRRTTTSKSLASSGASSSGHSSANTAAKRRAKEAKRRQVETERQEAAGRDKDHATIQEEEEPGEQRGRENRRAGLSRTRSRSLTDMKRESNSHKPGSQAEGDSERGKRGRKKGDLEHLDEDSKSKSRRGTLHRTRSRSLSDLKRVAKKDSHGVESKHKRSSRKPKTKSEQGLLKRAPSTASEGKVTAGSGEKKTTASIGKPKNPYVDKPELAKYGSMQNIHDNITTKTPGEFSKPYLEREIKAAIAAVAPAAERPSRRERGVQRTRSRSLSDMNTARRGGRKPGEKNVLSSARKEYKTAGAIADGKASSSFVDWIAHGKQALERFESQNVENDRKAKSEGLESDQAALHTRLSTGSLLAARRKKNLDSSFQGSATSGTPTIPDQRVYLQRTKSRSLTDLRAEVAREEGFDTASDFCDDGIFYCGEDEREIARLKEKIAKLGQDLVVVEQLEESEMEEIKEDQRLMLVKATKKANIAISPKDRSSKSATAVADEELERLTNAADKAKSIIKYLKGENEKRREEQKEMKVKMFDLYQETLRLESATEKTHEYFAQLEGIHRAELTKNHALEKNAPILRKVVEAHELKLARRLRYVNFERKATLDYIRNMRAIVHTFQSSCTDLKLVRYLERMTGLDQSEESTKKLGETSDRKADEDTAKGKKEKDMDESKGGGFNGLYRY